MVEPIAPTGEQYEIKAAGYAATITESGATLRLLTKDGRQVVDGFPEDEIPGACRGQLLMPWPNRIRDGLYTFEGQEHQLGLSEPHTHNAIHGLVRWATWHVVEHTEARIELGLRLMAQNGYPWTLELGVVYELVLVVLENLATSRFEIGLVVASVHLAIELGEDLGRHDWTEPLARPHLVDSDLQCEIFVLSQTASEHQLQDFLRHAEQ